MNSINLLTLLIHIWENVILYFYDILTHIHGCQTQNIEKREKTYKKRELNVNMVIYYLFRERKYFYIFGR